MALSFTKVAGNVLRVQSSQPVFRVSGEVTGDGNWGGRRLAGQFGRDLQTSFKLTFSRP